MNGHPKVTLSVVPKRKLSYAVTPATFETPQRVLPEYAKVSDKELNYRRPVDSFDRSIMPEAANAVKAHMQIFIMFILITVQNSWHSK